VRYRAFISYSHSDTKTVAAMHRWFQQRVQDGIWPPLDPQGQLGADGEL
jgi:hypothetical protein